MRLLRPVDKKFPITSPYGIRVHPVTKELNSFHKGVDFGCPIGTPCVACFDGYVGYIRDKDDGNGAGNRLGLYSKTHRALYFHLDDDGIRCKVGWEVKKGDLLAFSGNTGLTDGPHLHFGLENLKTMNHEEPIFDEDNIG